MPKLQDVRRDQNGVVWFDAGMMSRAAFEALNTGVAFDDLPEWDSHEQDIVEVD